MRTTDCQGMLRHKETEREREREREREGERERNRSTSKKVPNVIQQRGQTLAGNKFVSV